MVAVRLNAMYHENDVPRRDVEKYERWGIAPSVTLGIESPTRVTLSYLHQEDDNIPTYGVPYYVYEGGLLPGAPYSGYFGFGNMDRQQRSEEHTSELQSLMRTSYAVFCLKKKKN